MYPVKTQLKRNLMWCWMLNMFFRRIPMLPFTHLLSINKALLRFQGVVDHQQLLDYGWISSLAPKGFASRLVGKNHVANSENCCRADATSTRSFDNPNQSYNNNIIISLITIDALSQCWPCYSEWLTSRPWRQISSWTFHGLHRRFSTASRLDTAVKLQRWCKGCLIKILLKGVLKSIYSI